MIDELKNEIEKNSNSRVRVVDVGGDIPHGGDNFVAVGPNNPTMVLENIPVNLSDIVGLAATNQTVALINDGKPDFNILYQSDNPGIWALGMAILQDFIKEATLEADQESIRFTEAAAQTLRQKIIDQNEAMLKNIKKLADEDAKYNVGTNPSGSVGPKEKRKKPTWWQILIGFAIAIIFLAFAIFFPAFAVMGLTILLAVASACQLIASFTKGTASKVFGNIAKYVNPVNALLDSIFDCIELGMMNAGASEESLGKLDMAREIVKAVAMVALIIAAPFAGGGASMANLPNIMKSAASIMSGITQAFNGAYAYLEGKKKKEVADIQYEIDVARSIVEALRSFLQSVQDSIEAIIDHMKSVIESMNFNWSTAAEMVKSMGDTNVGIARSIGI